MVSCYFPIPAIAHIHGVVQTDNREEQFHAVHLPLPPKPAFGAYREEFTLLRANIDVTCTVKNWAEEQLGPGAPQVKHPALPATRLYRIKAPIFRSNVNSSIPTEGRIRAQSCLGCEPPAPGAIRIQSM